MLLKVDNCPTIPYQNDSRQKSKKKMGILTLRKTKIGLLYGQIGAFVK